MHIPAPLRPSPLLYCVVLLLSLLVGKSWSASTEYIIGVVPQMPPVTMHTNWTPFVERLAKETGLNLKLKVYEQMDAFENDFQSGTPDFLFSSPTQITLARESQGYIPLVRNSQTIKGILFVKKDSPYNDVSQLEGKNISFVGSKNLCSIFVRHELASNQPTKIKFNRIYAGSTNNVYKTVILGKADAGATLDVDIGRESPEITEQLRTIMSTEEINPHPLSAHPRVPEAIQQQVKETVLRLGKEESSQEMLKAIRIPKPVAADYIRDYKEIEVVNIRELSSEQ